MSSLYIVLVVATCMCSCLLPVTAAEGAAGEVSKGVAPDAARALTKDAARALAKDAAQVVAKVAPQAVAKDAAQPVAKDATQSVAKDATTTPKKTLAGVRPMRDRSNSTDPIPCTCGIFLSSQCKGGGQPTGLPAISHEFSRATSPSAAGNRQCTTACVDMIVKHLPNSAAILCSSIERDCMREKAMLYIKNNRNKWLATKLSAGREFCCRGGAPVRCPPK